MPAQADSWALIVAHPGHEGLIHGWIETVRPHVFILSDGGRCRMPYSRALLHACGAKEGAVFGAAPDTRWYHAWLTGDVTFFQNGLVPTLHFSFPRSCVGMPIWC